MLPWKLPKCLEVVHHYIGVFSRVQAEAVKYADASPVVLRHASLVLEETLSEDFVDAKAASEDDGVQYLMEMARICQEERNDRERVALLFEIAATNHGEGRALERCIDLSTDDATQSSRASRAVVVLENFVAQLLPKNRQQQFELSKEDLDKMEKYVLPSCRKVIHHFGDRLEISERLSVLFEVAWWSNPERFTRRALSGLQMLYCLSNSPVVLLHHAKSLWHTGASDAFNAKIRGGVQRVAAAQGESPTGNDGARGALARDCFQIRKQILQIALREAKGRRLRSQVAGDLAFLLETGAEGVEADAREAVALYRRAIEEGNDVPAMNSLAFLLRKGGEGVEADAREAVALYRRAIEEGNDVFAMYNLASLLNKGAEGVEADAREAVALYERAIMEGDLVCSMYNLAELLETGGDGVDADEERAARLYEQAGNFHDAGARLGALRRRLG